MAMELIPDLPEEIGRECLLRVPYKEHCKLKAVCRNWEKMVNNSCFYEDRKRCGSSELCICVVLAFPQGNFVEDKRQRSPAYALSLYDPLEGSWERLPSIPQLPEGLPLFCRCVCVRQKLVLIGGWHPSHWEAMRSVFVYDFPSGKWRQGTDMPTVRSFFACSVSPDGLVYVAGGHDDNKNALRAAEVYSVEDDCWKILPSMTQERDECQGVHADGKFYVISGYTTESQGRFERNAEFFDPNTDVWTRVENMWSLGGCPRSCVISNGNLYFFHKQDVFQYSFKENVWNLVDSVPEIVNSATCATVWRDRIFVSGSACSGGDQTCYMFDLSAAKTKGGKSSRRWVKVHRPHNFSGFLQSAATLEI